MGMDDPLCEPDDWFASEYAKVNGEEDRAMIFRAESWWNNRQHLRKEAEYLLEKAKPVFGEIFAGE